jgi:hypothetical protein
MNKRSYEIQRVRRADLTIVPAIRGCLSDRLGWGLGSRGPVLRLSGSLGVPSGAWSATIHATGYSLEAPNTSLA